MELRDSNGNPLRRGDLVTLEAVVRHDYGTGRCEVDLPDLEAGETPFIIIHPRRLTLTRRESG